MTEQKQPEALRLAGLLELAPEDGVEPQTTEDAAAELRRLHTRIAELQARIKTMAEEHADELMVAHLDGRMRAGQPAGAQQPAPSAAAHKACKPDMLVNSGALKLALNVLRRAGKHEVADELEATAQPTPTPQADSAPLAAPADTVVLEAALRAIHQAIDLIGEPDTERLRTVRRVLRGAVVVAEDSTAPQADSQPAPVREHDLQDVRCECCGYMTYHREHMGCIRAARAPADSVTAPAGGEIDRLRAALVYVAFALHGKPQYMLAEGIALIDGDTVRVSRDGWTVEASVNPARATPAARAADSVLEDAARLDWLLLHISGAEFRRIGVHYSGNASRADVDAARKQGANHD